MEYRAFTKEAVQEVAAKVDGARYLYVSPELYRFSLKLTMFTCRIELCPMVLLMVPGKVWGVSAETDHDIEVMSLAEVQRRIEMYDAETAEDKAARAIQAPTLIAVKSKDKAPTKHYFKPMSESAVLAVEEMEAA